MLHHKPLDLRHALSHPSGSRRALVTCTLLAAVAGLLAAPLAAEEELNRVVLRVNDEILTLYDYEQRKATQIETLLADQRMGQDERQERLQNMGQDTMQQLFREMLLESFASQNGMSVSERDIDDAVNEIKERQGIETTQQLLEALSSAGLTLEKLRQNMRQELMMSNVVRREVTGKIEVSDDELRAYYRNNPEQFQVAEERHLQEVIVLEDSGLDAEQLLATANELHRRLASGELMADVIAEYQDKGETTGLIDLGWLDAKGLETSLSDAAFSLEEGAWSTPVEGRGGYHVLHTAEIREGFVRPFEDVEPQILQRERQRRFGSELRKFMANLESTSYVKENIPPDAVGYRSLGEELILEDELRDFRAPILEAGEELEEAVQESVAPEDS